MLAWLNGLIGAFVAPVISAILNSVFGALRTKRLDHENDATHERAATAEAGNETLETIAEVADARAETPNSPVDADELAGELRREKSAPGRGNRKRPF